MCLPALKGYYSSGWHLHESRVDSSTGKNLLEPEDEGRPLSSLGMQFLAGLLQHAGPSSVFATPTLNGYRRLRPNSLAPDRAGWGYDHRGAMVRVLGGAGDPDTRLENRLGEPAANPYLYVASQIVAGLDGVERGLEPGARDDDPYVAERPRLPKGLSQALDALEHEPLFRRELGEVFINYFLRLKRNELGRFETWLKQQHLLDEGDEPTAWEQNEYFDFF
jgi:glutamine synthetase